jgi:hypothetical protein
MRLSTKTLDLNESRGSKWTEGAGSLSVISISEIMAPQPANGSLVSREI